MLAAGVAVRQLVPEFAIPGASVVLALACVALAGVLAATSYPRWRRVQLAMRAGAALPPNRLILVLAAGMALIAVLAAVLVTAG